MNSHQTKLAGPYLVDERHEERVRHKPWYIFRYSDLCSKSSANVPTNVEVSTRLCHKQLRMIVPVQVFVPTFGEQK
jgi:hypothetical protein